MSDWLAFFQEVLDYGPALLAGLGNTGNRFIVDLENGKPTVQLQKVLDLMDLLGLEVVVRTKASRSTSSL